MLVLLALAVAEKTLLEAMACHSTRRRLRVLARASPGSLSPFLVATLSAEPWLALNALGDAVLLPWAADLLAFMGRPGRFDIRGQLPVRPIAALARLRRPAPQLTRRNAAVRSLSLCWARALMPPELLECVVDFVTRGRIWRAGPNTDRWRV